MKKNKDIIFSRILMVICAIIIVYWIWSGLIWLWEWYVSVSTSENTTVWAEIWLFMSEYISVIALVYGIMSLQVAGLAELKFQKNFLKAFGLSIVLTPPIMMAVYGHKRIE